MSESTPSPSDAPRRSVLRDMSNSVGRAASTLIPGFMSSWVTPTKPIAPTPGEMTPGYGSDAETPKESWQSADNFRFVEQDDDEVLFRVRDSGVLRSLALPGIPAGNNENEESRKDAALETIEQKQVCVLPCEADHHVHPFPTAHIHAYMLHTMPYRNPCTHIHTRKYSYTTFLWCRQKCVHFACPSW